MSFSWSPAHVGRVADAPRVKHVLYYFDGPKMVLSEDARERQVVGIAIDEDDDGTMRWLFAPVSPEKVVGMLEHKQALRPVFLQSMVQIFDVAADGDTKTCWTLLGSDVPGEFLPDEHAVIPELVEEIQANIITEQRNLMAQAKRFASARLLFRGQPVRGTRGIDALFAAECISGFQTIVTTEHQHRNEELGRRGPIPWIPEAAMLLTDMPRASVGFEFTEEEGQARSSISPLAEVVTDISELMDAAATGDDEYAELAVNFDSRVIQHVNYLLDGIRRHGASLLLEAQGREYSFDSDRLSEAVERTSTLTKETEDKEIEGVLVGFTPNGRRFELEAAPGEVIKGNISRTADLDYIGAFFRKRCLATVRIATVKRHATESRGYMLLSVVALERTNSET